MYGFGDPVVRAVGPGVRFWGGLGFLASEFVCLRGSSFEAFVYEFFPVVLFFASCDLVVYRYFLVGEDQDFLKLVRVCESVDLTDPVRPTLLMGTILCMVGVHGLLAVVDGSDDSHMYCSLLVGGAGLAVGE